MPAFFVKLLASVRLRGDLLTSARFRVERLASLRRRGERLASARLRWREFFFRFLDGVRFRDGGEYE